MQPETLSLLIEGSLFEYQSISKYIEAIVTVTSKYAEYYEQKGEIEIEYGKKSCTLNQLMDTTRSSCSEYLQSFVHHVSSQSVDW